MEINVCGWFDGLLELAYWSTAVLNKPFCEKSLAMAPQGGDGEAMGNTEVNVCGRLAGLLEHRDAKQTIP